MANFHKQRADGYCGACGEEVSEDALNRFYCSDYCMYLARVHHQELEDEKRRDDGEEWIFAFIAID